jgi:glycerol uptake facilitator-like aquaporin
MYGVGLAMVVFVSTIGAGRLTGGCINPVRVFGPSLIRGIYKFIYFIFCNV